VLVTKFVYDDDEEAAKPATRARRMQ